MYLTKLEIENTGPIDSIALVPEFLPSGNPKPLVLVGENGSGKSIVLSHIVNTLLSMKQIAYPEDVEVEVGKVYKLRSPLYIKYGKTYSRSQVTIDSLFIQQELMLSQKKGEFIKNYGRVENYPQWDVMPADETSHFHSSFQFLRDQIRTEFTKSCVLYFPANRFEEPAWLNRENLLNRSNYFFCDKFSGSNGS